MKLHTIMYEYNYVATFYDLNMLIHLISINAKCACYGILKK